MTRDEILSLSVGPELDRLVMENVFNAKRNYHDEEEYWYHYDENGEPDYEWSAYNSPSTDISAAWEVESAAISQNEQNWATAVTIVLGIDNWILSAENIKKIAHMSAWDRCKAALLAVLEGKVEESCQHS